MRGEDSEHQDKMSRMTHKEFLLIKLYREELHPDWKETLDSVVEKHGLTSDDIERIRSRNK